MHPEKLPKNPDLERLLAPLESVRLSIRDTYTHYPAPQLVWAAVRGAGKLPDDPDLRATVLSLAARYEPKRQEKVNAAKPPNDDSDLEPKIKITGILTLQQIEALKSGKPNDKRMVLESIPEDKQIDFVYSIQQNQRGDLAGLAPLPLRRQLLLATNPENVVGTDLLEAKLERAIYSNHQLEELLVDFWFNHFNVYLKDGAFRLTLPSYERDAIRRHVFGKFFDMLDTARSPAMPYYLDNWQSVGVDAPENRDPKKKNKRGLNENYARELMELHTLGVDGGYTQQDVINVARCLTGWTIQPPNNGGGFEYNDKMHDKAEKVVLGHTLPAGGGENDGIEVLEILAHRPSTAHFICLKLARRFVSDDPPPSIVARMAASFVKSDGDLWKVVEAMLHSREFWSVGAYQTKVKTPFEHLVSSVRASNATVTSTSQLANILQQMDEPLYRKLQPTGYSSANRAWVSTASLLARMTFALAFANNRVDGVKVEHNAWRNIMESDPINLVRYLLNREPTEATCKAILKVIADPELQKQLMQNAKAGPPRATGLIAGLVLGSPDFQKR